MNKLADTIQKKPWLGWLLFLGTLGAVFLLGLFATSISERRLESKKSFEWITPIGEQESDSAVWGKNFPREYDSWKATQDTSFKSKYNGSTMIDMLEINPRLVVLWAGYGFSKDYNQGRGHYYSVTDIRNTLRTDETAPGTCWTCKSSNVPRLMNHLGVADFYKDTWMHLGPEITNAIGCLDCHDPKTLNLRISRPALVEAFQRQGNDIKKATHQEMRSLVCAQCHIEYYFKDDGKYLTLPWDRGTTVEAMEAYYDEYQFKDFTHKLSRTPIVKPQHPDWETFQLGIHAQRGLACADCHMPYRSEGGVKFSNHKVQSPLNNIANTCLVCHRESEETLRNSVYERQDKISELRTRAEDLLVRAHIEAKTAWDLGATTQEMEPILAFIRKAQWRWDFVAASHGASFHAPLESARILGNAIEQAGQARLSLVRVLSKHGKTDAVALPDISTKAKAQSYLGLDMPSLKKKKEAFRQETLPQWENKAN
ncbi:MAG: ammonia-forming cytochrome c nitrite reductase [Chrysiogenales bacterium]|nr:MAG: ammonia-forming cytochrome c nitrite reductase [Chrysiogenales bacterium]